MFQTLDIIISFGVVFLILSMVHKYFLSVIKRLCRIKANISAQEMKNFFGADAYEYLLAYLDKKEPCPSALNFINRKKTKGLGKLDKNHLTGAINELSEYLRDKAPEQIRQELDGVDAGKLSEVKARLDTLLKRMDVVYNDLSCRMKEAYEGKLRMWNFGWAIVLVVLINADFFEIYNSLSMQTLSREKLAARAEIISNQTEEIMARLDKKEEGQASEIKEDVKKAEENILELKYELEEAGLQMGWTEQKFSQMLDLPKEEEAGKKTDPEIFMKNKSVPELIKQISVTSAMSKILGFLIAGLLISFGAPFWHDLLSTFAGLNKLLRGKEKGGKNNPQKAE